MQILNNPDLQNLGHIWLILMIAVTLVCFVTSELTLNYSQVDKLWSLLPMAYGWITFSSSPSPRVFVMSLMVTVWGLRLTYNFSRKGGYNIIPWNGEEDYRWKFLKEQPLLKGRLRFGLFNLFFISIYQNIVIMLFSSPLLIASLFPDKPLTILDLIAAITMLSFIIIETIADNQLFEFHRLKKKVPGNSARYAESLRNGFLSEGLWKFSRHPNFASEQAIWICFYLFGIAASGRWLNVTITGPVLLLLIFAGSSRLTESISGKKYPGYANYRRHVPRFVPLPSGRRFSINVKPQQYEQD